MISTFALRGKIKNVKRFLYQVAYTIVATILSRGGLISGFDMYYLGLSKVALIEGCPHVRGGLYEGFHCTNLVGSMHVCQ